MEASQHDRRTGVDDECCVCAEELINDSQTPCCRQQIHKDCLARCAGVCPLCRSVVTLPTPEIPTPTFGCFETVRLHHDRSYGLGAVDWNPIPGSYAAQKAPYPEEAQPSGWLSGIPHKNTEYLPVLEHEMLKAGVDYLARFLSLLCFAVPPSHC